MLDLAEKIERVNRALRFAEASLGHPCTIEHLGQQAGWSASTFHRHFSALLDYAPYTYLMRRRLTRASQELLHSRTTVARIGDRAGFETPQSFSKAFRSHFGVGPQAYREHSDELWYLHQAAATETALWCINGSRFSRIPDQVGPPAQAIYGLGGTTGYEEAYGLLEKLTARIGWQPRVFALGWSTPESVLRRQAHYFFGIDDPQAADHGLERCELPATRYAKFSHCGSRSDFGITSRFIWDIWLERQAVADPGFSLSLYRLDQGTPPLILDQDLFMPIGLVRP